MSARGEARAALEALLRERPDFHGSSDATNWQLDGPLLDWLVGEVPLGGRTLETGCGYSTVVLSQLSAEHVAISPVAVEHDRIRRWCGDQRIPLHNVELVEAESERHLPALDAAEESVDLVLIDGDHAFPVPALDWYFTAPLLKIGGLVVVDDTHIRACAQVAAVLRADERNWSLRHRAGNAAVFVKRGRNVHGRGDWRSQPWNRQVRTVDSVVQDLRGKVRLRTRLRAASRQR